MWLLYVILYPFCCIRYGIKIDKFKEQGDRAYLILYNHQTAFDQFFVGIAFHGPIYYVASEDLFSNGIVSAIIRYLVAPIPIKKQTTDVQAVMNCMRLAKEGGTIAIAPEGNRTYSGKTEYMNPAIATMARKMRLPIALYRIEGGYGTHPRWSDVVRKGKMRGYVSRVIEPEECASMTPEELCAVIEKELYVNEAVADATFKSKKKAEYLERAMYVCPYCGLSEFYSIGNEISCKKCNRTISYGEDKSLKGVGFEFPFLFVNDWYEHQKHFINQLDVLQYIETPLYEDRANVSEVIVYKKKVKIFKEATILLYGNRIVINKNNESLELLFDDVSACSVLGRNKLNVYHKDKIYQFKGDKRFNALKYVNIYYRYKNISTGDENGEFLGL
jgi:1-acyl-sn-glycerol-3-phosphate acyltransferase